MSDEPRYDTRQPVRTRLNSWKEIATYLEKGLSSRTAQRWEAQEGLPVYREGARVFAYTDELDRWKAARVVGPAVKNMPDPGESPEIEPSPQEKRKSDSMSGIAVLLSALVIIVAAIVVISVIRRPREASAVHWGRLLAKAASEGGNVRRFALNNKADSIAATPDGRKVYAAGNSERSLSIIHTTDGRVATLRLPRDGGALAMSPDGKTLYAGSTVGGIMVIDTRSDSVVNPILETAGPVIDLAITPDGKKVFAAMSRKGVWRVLTATGAMRQVTHQVCPEHVAVDPPSKNLYVSYQCGGPNGRDGHDSMEIFDVETERSLQIVGGPPMVGGALSISPDAQVIVLAGGDACKRPKYDHDGCPSVPSEVFHFLRLDDRQFFKTLGIPSEEEASAQFIDSQRLLFLGNSIEVMDASSYTLLEKWNHTPEVFRAATLVPNLRGFYVGVDQQKEIVALEAEDPVCSPPVEGLVTWYPGDGVLEDAVGGASLEAVGGVEFGPGRVGQAFVLNGKSGYLTEPWRGRYRFGRRDSSITFYAKFASVDREMALFDGTSTHTSLGPRLTKAEDQHLVFESPAHGKPLRLVSTTTVAPNQWYHVAVTKNDDEIALYVNGSREDWKTLGSGQAYGVAEEAIGFYLGATKDHQRFFQGKLDEILFYNRALSAAEIRQLFAIQESKSCRN